MRNDPNILKIHFFHFMTHPITFVCVPFQAPSVNIPPPAKRKKDVFQERSEEGEDFLSDWWIMVERDGRVSSLRTRMQEEKQKVKEWMDMKRWLETVQSAGEIFLREELLNKDNMRNLKEAKKESKLIRNGNDFHLIGWRPWWSRME